MCDTLFENDLCVIYIQTKTYTQHTHICMYTTQTNTHKHTQTNTRYREMLELKNFAGLNYTAVIKIVKKANKTLKLDKDKLAASSKSLGKSPYAPDFEPVDEIFEMEFVSSSVSYVFFWCTCCSVSIIHEKTGTFLILLLVFSFSTFSKILTFHRM
jgi:hypothetical protein